MASQTETHPCWTNAAVEHVILMNSSGCVRERARVCAAFLCVCVWGCACVFRSVVPASLRKDQVGKARGEHDHHSVNRAATVEQEMFGPHQNGGGGGVGGGGGG